MKWGETSGGAIDGKGTIFAFTCAEPPIVELSAAGKVLLPHGIRFDKDGNMLTDSQNIEDHTNGQLVYKISPTTKF